MFVFQLSFAAVYEPEDLYTVRGPLRLSLPGMATDRDRLPLDRLFRREDERGYLYRIDGYITFLLAYVRHREPDEFYFPERAHVWLKSGRVLVRAFLPQNTMFRFLTGHKTFLCFQWMDPGLKLSRALESWDLRQKRG